MSEITIVIDEDDAGYVAVALREHSAKMRKYATERTNLADILLQACERIDRVTARIERELKELEHV